MTHRLRALIVCAAALTAAALGAGCDLTADHAPASKMSTTPARTTASPPQQPVLRGEPARVAAAVAALGRTLRDGDVERFCRPRAIFTAAVVAEMDHGGVSCEASVEDTLAASGPPALTVIAVSVEPGLATAQVRVRGGATVPLTLLRDGRRWLVSFSNGNDPLAALNA